MVGYLDQLAYEGSACTERNYRTQLAPFERFCDQRKITTLEGISPDTVRAYLKAEQHAVVRLGGRDTDRTIGRSTLIARYSVLRVFLEWCVTEGHLPANPMATVPRPKREKRIRHAFTAEEVRRLLTASKEADGKLAARDHAIVTALLGTGARASELLGLTWANVKWDEGYFVVFGKGAKERRLRMGKPLRTALRKWRDAAPKIPGDWVWVTTRRTPMSLATLEGMCRRLGEYADVPNCHPHRFRHTFAAEFTRLNRDVVATKARLGHARISTTEEYLHSLGVDHGLDESYKTPDEWLR